MYTCNEGHEGYHTVAAITYRVGIHCEKVYVSCIRLLLDTVVWNSVLCYGTPFLLCNILMDERQRVTLLASAWQWKPMDMFRVYIMSFSSTDTNLREKRDVNRA